MHKLMVRAGSAMRRKAASRAGVSMAEMLVCTILFSLAFMVGISGLLFAYDSTTNVMKAADAQTVSDIILNRIEGELANMAREGDPPVISEEGSRIDFTNGDGVPVYITATPETPEGEGKKYLLVYYAEVKSADQTVDRTIAESYWRFDPVLYEGYYIETLTFKARDHYINGKKRYAVTVTLTLKSDETSKGYTTNRTVWCANREDSPGAAQPTPTPVPAMSGLEQAMGILEATSASFDPAEHKDWDRDSIKAYVETAGGVESLITIKESEVRGKYAEPERLLYQIEEGTDLVWVGVCLSIGRKPNKQYTLFVTTKEKAANKGTGEMKGFLLYYEGNYYRSKKVSNNCYDYAGLYDSGNCNTLEDFLAKNNWEPVL